MQVATIIQARMGSSRFPGKSLYELQGKPSLEHLLDSVRQVVALDNIYVATSTNKEDEAINDFAKHYGVNAFRGHPTNVASRFLETVRQSNCSHFVRLSGDSPLFDYRNLNGGLKLSQEDNSAIISSSYEKSLPSGMNFEIFPAEVFIDNYPNFSLEDDFEHVTRFFYSNSSNFNIQAFPKQVEGPENYHFSFDTDKDRLRIEKLFSLFEKPHYDYTLKEKCALYDSIRN